MIDSRSASPAAAQHDVVFYALFPSVPDVFDLWIPAFAYPSFVGGVIFSALLWLAEGGRRFDELSLLRIAAWGAVADLLLGVLPFALGTPSAKFPLWLLVAGRLRGTEIETQDFVASGA